MLALVACSSSPADGPGGSGGQTGGNGGIGGGQTGGAGGEGAAGGAGGAGGEGATGGAGAPVERVIVADGRSVRLLDVSSRVIQQLDAAEIPSTGLLAGHQIFSAVVDPDRSLVFVGSANDCSPGADWCGGNGRIDRFAFTRSAIVYDGLAYEMNDAAFEADGITCAEGTDAETGFPGQEGLCVPLGLALSPDGSRLYMVNRRGGRFIGLFSVDPLTRDLAFVAQGGSPGNGGIASHPDSVYVYNGAEVYDVSGSSIVPVEGNGAGNATEVVEGSPDVLVTTLDESGFGVFDLADPSAPVEIDSISVGAYQVRHQAHDEMLSRFVIVGRNAVRALSFDGATLAIEDEAILSSDPPQQNRGVTITGENDELAVVTFFRAGGGVASIEAGGVDLYEIDPSTGGLSLLDSAELDGPGRVALTVVAR